MGICLAAISLFLTYASPSPADFDPAPGTQGVDILLVSDDYARKVDEAHQKTSELLLSATDWLDSFVCDDRYLSEENTTRARLCVSYGYSRFDGFDVSPG